MNDSLGQATTLLSRWSRGDRAALDEVVQLLYSQMHVIAAREVRGERNLEIEPTVLVNEVYLRLVQLSRVDWRDRAHFLAMCARVSRQALVDEARRRRAAKRDAGVEVTLTMSRDGTTTGGFGVLEVDDLLNELAALDASAARVVELRVFGGLVVDEVAEQLSLSPATVKRKWRSGKAWLARQLGVVPGDD